MALEEYRKKRRFSNTPEPSGAVPKKSAKKAAKKSKSKALQFVVQKHAATRLHYDFRLEFAGVLKSWAVPKGPSLDPKDKRLAVEVEDHPLEYGKFEGTIPQGEYGGGEVIVWDRGTWTPGGDVEQGLRKGKLEFELHGEKLTGGWVLFRIKNRSSSDKPNWLLVKRRDDAARPGDEYDITEDRPESVKSGRKLGEKKPSRVSTTQRARIKKAPRAKARPTRRKKSPDELHPEAIAGAKLAKMPALIEPQLATLSTEAPSGEQWVHEIKFDGYRVICRVERGKATLITRNQQDWTHRYREIAMEAAQLPVESAILDGEVVALLPSGISSFQALQNSGKNGAATQLVYYAFDLLYLNGHDLRAAPLIERKEALKNLIALAPGSRLQWSDHFEDEGPNFFRQCCQMGLEGIISKRRDRPYVAGRTLDWLKTKCVAREELVIGGFTLSTAVKRGIGALLVGYFDGDELIYSGRVGTGFSTETLLDLRKRLEALKQPECPFKAVPSKERGRDVRWARPEMVAQVEFTGWTEGSILRHPSFQGLREDKPARQVTRPPSLALPEKTKPGPKETAAVARKKETTIPANLNIELTHPDRVLFPDSGLTKLGLAGYYAQVAKWMLPHVIDRPLSLVRCPDGQGEKCFYQKHAVKSSPKVLRRVEVQEQGAAEEYLAVADLEGLLALVQMSVLEIHPWGSRRDRLEQPDRLIFDLDPHENVAWAKVVEAARFVRDLLEKHGLESFVKTTGGKGLHVVVPLAPRRHEWDAAKKFCRHVAEQMVASAPSQYIATMSKAARKGKIFVDYLRNDRGATAIAPYSTRAKPGAPVSVPITWDELSPALRSDHFHVGNLPGRLKSLHSDPWEGFFEVKQTIPAKY